MTLNDEPVRAALKKNVIAYVPQTEEVDWNFPVLVSDVVMMGRYGKMGFLRIPGKEDKKLSPMHWNVSVLRAGSPPDRRAFRRPEKRVFLARALAQNGKVLLLDEPFTGVDVKTENAIIDLLRSLREEGIWCWSPPTTSAVCRNSVIM